MVEIFFKFHNFRSPFDSAAVQADAAARRGLAKRRAEPTARPPRALPEASLAVPLPGGPWSCSALAAVSQHLSPSGAAAVCAPVPPVPPKDAGGGNAGRRARGRGPTDATREAAWGARPVWTPENPVTAEDRERDDAGTVRGFRTP